MRYKNLILFILLSFAWGTAFNSIKIGLRFFPPVFFASMRYFIAGIIMVIYALKVNKKFFPKTKKEFLQIVLAGLFMIALYHSFLFIGEKEIDSGVASIIVSLSPVLTTGFARLFLPKERLDKYGLFGLGLGFLGILLLLSPDLGNIFSMDIYRILVFFAAASFAFGSVLIRFFESDLSIESLESLAMLVGAFFMFLISLGLNEEIFSIKFEITGILALMYLAIISSSLGFLIYFNLLQDLGPIEVNLVSYSAPVFATFFGVTFLNEALTFKSVFALLVIFLGFFFLKRKQIKRELKKIK